MRPLDWEQQTPAMLSETDFDRSQADSNSSGRGATATQPGGRVLKRTYQACIRYVIVNVPTRRSVRVSTVYPDLPSYATFHKHRCRKKKLKVRTELTLQHVLFGGQRCPC